MSTEGRRIPVPGFAQDDGKPDASLARALGGLAAGTSSNAQVLVALTGARLLVPVVALLESVKLDPDTGLAREKESSMATVTVTGADGRRALLAFTGTQTLAAWRADARPVAVTARDAARAALDEGADALVVDLAGPVPYAVEGQTLRYLAAGYRLAAQPDGGSAWVVPVRRTPDP